MLDQVVSGKGEFLGRRVGTRCGLLVFMKLRW